MHPSERVTEGAAACSAAERLLLSLAAAAPHASLAARSWASVCAIACANSYSACRAAALNSLAVGVSGWVGGVRRTRSRRERNAAASQQLEACSLHHKQPAPSTPPVLSPSVHQLVLHEGVISCRVNWRRMLGRGRWLRCRRAGRWTALPVRGRDNQHSRLRHPHHYCGRRWRRWLWLQRHRAGWHHHLGLRGEGRRRCREPVNQHGSGERASVIGRRCHLCCALRRCPALVRRHRQLELRICSALRARDSALRGGWFTWGQKV